MAAAGDGTGRPTNASGVPTLSELEALLVAMAMHQPVLQHVASIRFPGARDERLARAMYAKSAATSSALGHVTGLGDRHGGNMRLDINRHEVVHIDFGICFEQAKLQSCPEWVPFRLTREVVSCMGVRGVEGTFRASMESSMECLRERRSMVLSLLRTFLADPLAKWQSVVEKLAHKAVSSSSSPVEDGSSAGDQHPAQGGASNGKGDTSGAKGAGAAGADDAGVGDLFEDGDVEVLGESGTSRPPGGLMRHNETVR